MTRGIASAAAQLAGIAAITVGCWLIAPWVGLVVGGLLLVMLGVALDPPTRRPRANALPGLTLTGDVQ